MTTFTFIGRKDMQVVCLTHCRPLGCKGREPLPGVPRGRSPKASLVDAA